MNKRQRAILVQFITVILITVVAVVAMIAFKDFNNRSEATQAMEQLGKMVFQYRETHGSVPPESYVKSITENMPGNLRLHKLRYRALWIESESKPDEILAYTELSYRSLFLGEDHIVLRLSGQVEWIQKEHFEALLAQQQSPMEKEVMNY